MAPEPKHSLYRCWCGRGSATYDDHRKHTKTCLKAIERKSRFKATRETLGRHAERFDRKES